MSEEVLSVDILSELKAKAHESYNGGEIASSELSLFAERMDNGEKPVRFYDAKTRNTDEGSAVEGKILSTDDKLIFIGNPDGTRVGAAIKYENLIGAEINVNVKDKSMATLVLIVKENGSGLEYSFEMSRFGLNALADYIMGKTIPH